MRSAPGKTALLAITSTAIATTPRSPISFERAARDIIQAKNSPHTQRAYHADLTGWIAFCELQGIDPRSPTLADVTIYRDALVGSDDSRRRRLATMSSIYQTLRRITDEQRQPMVAGNPFHPDILVWPRAGDVLKAVRISDEQGIEILDAARVHARDHAVLTLLFDTGWRRSAIASLPRANYRDGRVFNRQKGDKEQDVELPDGSVASIERWLRERRTSSFLFPARDGDDHMHENTVNKIVTRWAKVVAPKAHPHSFRALFIRSAHDAGLPGYEIQGAAGHSSADMTARYDGKTRGTGVARQLAQFRARNTPKKAP